MGCSKKSAVWVKTYDSRTDKSYDAPGCPDCMEPIGRYGNGRFYCFSCGKEILMGNAEMFKWYQERRETKTEYEDCFPEDVKLKNGEKVKMGCGGKKCMLVRYRRNPVTMEWESAGGKCARCGMNFVV